MRVGPLVAVAALAGTVVAGQLTGSRPAPTRAAPLATAPVAQTTLVCPRIEGSSGSTTQSVAVVANVSRALNPPSTAAGPVTTTVLRGASSRTTSAQLRPGIAVAGGSATDGALAVNASGSAAATVVADQVTITSAGRFRALTGARCVEPSADWWFAGADGRVGYSDTLVLANPTGTAADVSVSVWSAKGPLSPPRLAAVPVPARSSVTVAIPTVAPDAATLALHVHATSGAVTAALLDQRLRGVSPAGSDWVPATRPPARSLVVAGYPGGSGTRTVVVANPGAQDATVGVRIVNGSGEFAPSGVNQVMVPAGQTRIVDLTRALAGSTGAVMLQSDQPVVAQGLAVTTASRALPDLQWLAALPPLAGPGAFADGHEPDGGQTRLLLTAPAGAATVRVGSLSGHSETITVPAGHSVISLVTGLAGSAAASSGLVVTPQGSAPVYVTRMLFFAGAHGALTTSEPVLALPSPVRLPAVTADQRAAIRPAG